MKKIAKTLALVTIGVAIGRAGKGKINHFITKYREGENLKAEAWIQVDALGKSFCFSKKSIDIS
ncbi:hypothetical protein [Suicoccus acidiformans]|nr:hypothetical protein [Suicoccus acidiformans]